MARRALVIAVEQYPRLTGGGMARTLPGTLKAGLDFVAWLRAKWDAEGHTDTQLLLCTEPAQPGGQGASRDEIVDALFALTAAGSHVTEELFVFFSGHGFSFARPAVGRADYVIASDFRSPDRSAAACLQLDGIVAWLRAQLGPGRHYYFVDACRNVLDVTQIRPHDLDLPVPATVLDEPSSFVLQSTTPGAVAAVGSKFPTALLTGLAGGGDAKRYDAALPGAMVVDYGTLRRYVKTTLGQQQMVTSLNDGTDSEQDAILTTLRPIPTLACTVKIEEAEDTDVGTIRLQRGEHGVVTEHPLRGRRVEVPLQPDKYFVAVEIDGHAVDPDGFVPLPLFENHTLTFTRGAPVSLDTGLGAVAPLGRKGFEPPPRLPVATPEPPPPAWAGEPIREGVARRFPMVQGDVDFSESLRSSPTGPDLDVWLAILAGGAVLQGRADGDYQKIAQLALHRFDDEAPGAAPIYVLAGLGTDGPLDVGIGTSATDTTWTPAHDVAGLPGIFEAYVAATPGARLVSLRVPGAAACTLPLASIPNHATVLTASIDQEGDLQIARAFVPIGHLMAQVRRPTLDRRNHLHDVRALAYATQRFRARRTLDRAPLASLADGQWADPLAPALVAYDRLRRGDAGAVPPLADALIALAPELPDGAALAVIAGRPRPVAGIPVVQDGLRALGNLERALPLPPARLDRRNPWTLWRRAVD